jgi:hypothetical protein
VVAVRLDDDALDRFELDRTGHRKLDPELKPIDLQLQRWAPWARPHWGQLGYPTRSVHERMNEGGILARAPGQRVAPEWPPAIAALDAHIARLPTRHQAAIMANYFHLALPSEKRAQIYVRYAEQLARTRPAPIAQRRASLGSASFRDALDRSRWTLKALLGL